MAQSHITPATIPYMRSLQLRESQLRQVQMPIIHFLMVSHPIKTNHSRLGPVTTSLHRAALRAITPW